MVARWAQDDTRRVLAIAVDPQSPFRKRDYELWNSWKLNLIKALDESSAFVPTDQTHLKCGVGYTVYSRTPGAGGAGAPGPG